MHSKLFPHMTIFICIAFAIINGFDAMKDKPLENDCALKPGMEKDLDGISQAIQDIRISEDELVNKILMAKRKWGSTAEEMGKMCRLHEEKEHRDTVEIIEQTVEESTTVEEDDELPDLAELTMQQRQQQSVYKKSGFFQRLRNLGGGYSSDLYKNFLVKLLSKIEHFDCAKLERDVKYDFINILAYKIKKKDRKQAGKNLKEICDKLKALNIRTIPFGRIDRSQLDNVNREYIKMIDEITNAMVENYKILNPDFIPVPNESIFHEPKNFVVCAVRSVFRGITMPWDFMFHLFSPSSTRQRIHQSRKFHAMMWALIKLRDYFKEFAYEPLGVDENAVIDMEKQLISTADEDRRHNAEDQPQRVFITENCNNEAESSTTEHHTDHQSHQTYNTVSGNRNDGAVTATEHLTAEAGTTVADDRSYVAGTTTEQQTAAAENQSQAGTEQLNQEELERRKKEYQWMMGIMCIVMVIYFMLIFSIMLPVFPIALGFLAQNIVQWYIQDCTNLTKFFEL